MNAVPWIIVGAVFVASLVESVECLSVVLAIGFVNGYRKPLYGVGAGSLILAAFVAAGGLPLVHYLPVRALQAGMGLLALYIGQGWIRKAVLRASGRKALHSEQKTYAETTEKVRSGASGFRLSLGATLLEGSEVLLIVVAFGAGSGHLAAAGIAAIAACLTVAIIGAIIAKPMAKLDENRLKLIVAVVLCSVGIFWTGEAAGIHWPASDASLLALVSLVSLATLAVIRLLKIHPETQLTSTTEEAKV